MKELTFEEKLTINGGIDENRWGGGTGTAASSVGWSRTFIIRRRKKRKARVKGFAGYIPE